MFIGDGMGNPQVTATQYYLGALQNPDSELPVPAALSFTGFENVGLMTTYDASLLLPGLRFHCHLHGVRQQDAFRRSELQR